MEVNSVITEFYYRGGAIDASSATIIIDRSRFHYNTQDSYYGSGGGAMYATSSNITIKGSTFTHNGIFGSGGAIYCSGILQVSNTVFIDNRAYSTYRRSDSRGAVYTTGANSSIIGCQFINNTVNGSGGGFYIERGSLTVNQCDFLNNTANRNGGGLYISEGSLRVTQCHFMNNIA